MDARSNNQHIHRSKKGPFMSFHLVSTRTAAIFSFLLFFAFIFIVALLASEGLFVVFIGFLPVFLYLVITFLLFSFEFGMTEVVYIFPIILSIIFYIVWATSSIPILNQMNGPMLTVLNIVVSFVFAALLSVLHPHGVDNVQGLGMVLENPEPIIGAEKFEEPKKVSEKPIPEPEEMSVTIRGIEDKCKAINFVIGRVYSDKRGGSKEIRSEISIPRELYNAFSELIEDNQIINPQKLLAVVNQITHRLKILEEKEEDLFDILEAKIPMEREKGDTVLEVLSRNDKDPIVDYHAEALEVCEQAVRFVVEN